MKIIQIIGFGSILAISSLSADEVLARNGCPTQPGEYERFYDDSAYVKNRSNPCDCPPSWENPPQRQADCPGGAPGTGTQQEAPYATTDNTSYVPYNQQGIKRDYEFSRPTTSRGFGSN